MEMKKPLSAISLLLVFSFLLGFMQLGAAQSSKNIVLMNVAENPAPPESVKETLERFEEYMAEKGTPVDVKLDNFKGRDLEYATKVTLRAESGDLDVAVTEMGRTQEYKKSGNFLPLTEYTEEWDLWPKIYETFRRAAKFEGEVYWVPMQTSSLVLYYRKDIFEEAGLTRDWKPKSWEDVISAAEQIKNELSGVTPILFVGGEAGGAYTTWCGFHPFIHGAGSLLYNEDEGKWNVTSEPLLNTFKLYETLREEELIEPKRSTQAEGSYVYRKFSEAKGAITISGSWAWEFFWGPGATYEISDLKKKVGYTKIPARTPGSSARGGNFVSQSGGWGYAISSSTDQPDIAWELIKFLSRTDIQAKWNLETGQVPVRSDVKDSQVFQESKFLADTSNWLEFTYVDPNIYPNWTGTVGPLVRESMQRIIGGDWTPEKAMQEFAKNMERELGEENVLYNYEF